MASPANAPEPAASQSLGLGQSRRWLWALLAAVVGLRLLTLGLYPLTDTTEARYAEMARKMLETGNWLTPMFDVGVPFWGKPPLSFWLSALPMGLFGVGEFTARLGPVLACGVTLALLWQWPAPSSSANTPKNIAGGALPICAALVFLSTPLGFIASGAVMTDMAMVAGTTLSMVAFWRAWTKGETDGDMKSRVERIGPGPGLWPWLFFVGQAIGLMAKGPVAVVLTGVALCFFLLVCAWRAGVTATVIQLWRALPWPRGLLLTALLVTPWYLLAEQATSGFLRYFIIGEHWYRFTQSGWKGDLYGVAHAQPKGRIWLFALVSTLPWGLAALWWLVRRRRQRAGSAFSNASERDYLLCWALAPCAFFTLSGNILPAYVLPGLPALALLIATLWQAAVDNPRASPATKPTPRPVWVPFVTPALCALLTPLAFTVLVLAAPARFDAFSDKSLLAGVPSERIAYLVERPASGVFYSRGQARLIATPEAIRAALVDPALERLLLPRGQLAAWQDALQAHGFSELARNSLTVSFGRRGPVPSTAKR